MTELLQPKESLVKLLLSTPTHIQASPNLSLSKKYSQVIHESRANDVADNEVATLINYFQQSSDSGDKEPDIVMMDHSYCRPWNWRPETSFMCPTKCLLVWRGGGSTNVGKMGTINVTDGTAPDPAPVYDTVKARTLMDDSERIVATIRPSADDNCEDWDTQIPRSSWSAQQNRLFSDILKILDEDRLGRLTYEGSWNEPVLRRNVIDKSVSRTRLLLAGIMWDLKLTQWLHGTLLDYLPRSYLIAYVDVLQSLRAKLPALIDRMLWGRGPTLRRPWEPGAPLAHARPPPQLPSPQPIFVLAPCGGPRAHRWAALLAQIGPVVQAQLPVQVSGAPDSLPATADRALAAVRARVAEACTGDRPVVLVGAGPGTALALQAADVDRVACCVCLAPALLTAEGRRGEPEDTALLDTPCPVLFVVGQCAHRCTPEIAEDVRERMRVRTGLVIVGSADDHLRMAKSRRRRHGVTQAIVDRCVLDEIVEFVGGVLSSPQQSQISQQSPAPPPPPPPPVKISRPVGRPPGSGRKKHVLPPPFPIPPMPSLDRPRHMLLPPPLPYHSPAPPPVWYVHRHSTKHKHHMHKPMLQQQKSNIGTASTGGQIVVGGREQRTAVKVLDSGTPHSRRTMDLSKVTLVNTAATHSSQSPQQHNVFVLADGTRCIRTSVPTTQQVTRLVPTRRHVTTNVRPTMQPPQQLTASEILDLPIIFADGDTPLLTDTVDTSEKQPQQHKYVLINKHGLQQQTVKRAANMQSHPQPKFARIIINNSQQQLTQHTNQSHQVQLEFVDLETELKTNTVPKPPHQPPTKDPD